MARYWKVPGPQGRHLFSLPHPDLQYRWAFDSEYSLPRTQLLRVSAPEEIVIQVLCTSRDDPGPGFERVPDPQATELLGAVDAEKKKRGFLAELTGARKVFVHVTFGAQVVHHRPFKHGDPKKDQTHSTEVDATIGADITLQFHDDDAPGFDFAIAVQGSGNYVVMDPNRKHAHISEQEMAKAQFAGQGQVQVQFAYMFKSFTILDTKVSLTILLQAAGSAAYQYDVEDRVAKLTGSATVATGLGAGIKLSDRVTWMWQGTLGPSTQGTVDFTVGTGLNIEFDITGEPKKNEKKK